MYCTTGKYIGTGASQDILLPPGFVPTALFIHQDHGVQLGLYCFSPKLPERTHCQAAVSPSYQPIPDNNNLTFISGGFRTGSNFSISGAPHFWTAFMSETDVDVILWDGDGTYRTFVDPQFRMDFSLAFSTGQSCYLFSEALAAGPAITGGAADSDRSPVAFNPTGFDVYDELNVIGEKYVLFCFARTVDLWPIINPQYAASVGAWGDGTDNYEVETGAMWGVANLEPAFVMMFREGGTASQTLRTRIRENAPGKGSDNTIVGEVTNGIRTFTSKGFTVAANDYYAVGATYYGFAAAHRVPPVPTSQQSPMPLSTGISGLTSGSPGEYEMHKTTRKAMRQFNNLILGD